MPFFKLEMIEQRAYDVEYIVNAKNPNEARELAALGDTVKETEIKCREVTERDIWDGPTKCEKPEDTSKKKSIPGLWIVVYHHKHGTEAHPLIKLGSQPSDEEAIKALELDFEEGDEEYVEVFSAEEVPTI
jgi:hypothetical protein